MVAEIYHISAIEGIRARSVCRVACRVGLVSPQESVTFTKWEQIHALNSGASVSEALQFVSWNQVKALKERATVAKALTKYYYRPSQQSTP